jgi:hypothetical protein
LGLFKDLLTLLQFSFQLINLLLFFDIDIPQLKIFDVESILIHLHIVDFAKVQQIGVGCESDDGILLLGVFELNLVGVLLFLFDGSHQVCYFLFIIYNNLAVFLVDLANELVFHEDLAKELRVAPPQPKQRAL